LGKDTKIFCKYKKREKKTPELISSIVCIPPELTLSILGPATGGIDFIDPVPCHGPINKAK
jgi:hypothetical protein